MFHSLSDRVRAGETLIGTWLYLADVGVAEVVAGAGYDFVIIDMEHSPTGFANLRNLIMALEHRTAPVVRAKQNSPEYISGVLDQGPAAVMVPRIRTAEESRTAVELAKYHPLGLRGQGPYRVSDYGRNEHQVLQNANDKQMLWLQVEHRDAVDNLDEIMAIAGIDLLFIGRGDLSQSMGHLGEVDHPDVEAVGKRACQTICQAGLPAGSAFGAKADLKSWHDAGMRIFTVSADFQFVIDGANATLSHAQENLKGGI